jgi:hypothetical protein
MLIRQLPAALVAAEAVARLGDLGLLVTHHQHHQLKVITEVLVVPELIRLVAVAVLAATPL